MSDNKIIVTDSKNIISFPSQYSAKNEHTLQRNTYNKDEEGDFNMDIEKYLDKVDQNHRESELRVREERVEMEKRIVEERRLSESRMEERFNQVMASVEKTNERIFNLSNSIDEKLNKLSDSVDKKMDKLSNSVQQNMKESTRWLIALCMTTIIGIAAIVVTVILK